MKADISLIFLPEDVVLVPLFARMFAPTAATRPNISTNGDGGSWFHYAEANIAGTIPYPE